MHACVKLQSETCDTLKMLDSSDVTSGCPASILTSQMKLAILSLSHCFRAHELPGDLCNNVTSVVALPGKSS